MIAPRSATPAARRPQAAPLLAALLSLPGFAVGQETPAPSTVEANGVSTPSKTKKFADLTVRYRFSERYTGDDAKAGPGIVGSYRVATKDVVRDSVEAPQGAPKRTESTRQAIYSERLAEAGLGVGSVASTVRAIEKYQAGPEDAARAMGTRPLEGATVLLRPRSGGLPLVLSLAPSRTLTDYEYDVLAHQVFVPSLPALLPTQSVRLGDTWRIFRKGAQALLGDPTLQGDTLVGKLVEVRKEVDGPRMVASISVAGKLSSPGAETTVNAEALFTFEGSQRARDASKKPSFPPDPTEGLMEARGAFTELRLASVASGPVPGGGRLRFQANRELTMHRQLGLGAGSAALPPFEKAPAPTEDNTWLAHVGPSGRYALRHPQELLPFDPRQSTRPGTTLLVRNGREGRDMLQVEFFGKAMTVEDLKKELAGKYAAMKMELVKGDEAWLPEAEWPGMRVHRIDAALKVVDPKAAAPGGSTRIHFDGYLIQFAQNATILAIASTDKEAVGPFRQEVEAILKSIKLDPPRSTPG